MSVYRHLERLAPSGLPLFRRGDLLSRMIRDVDSLQDLAIRVIPPYVIAVLVGSLTVTFMWWMLPAAGVVLAIALVLAATVVPWVTGSLARRKESRLASARGDLTVAMVDLTEGASELMAFGAVDAQLETVRSHDAELTALTAASAGTAGVGLAMTTGLAGLACWGCLLAGIPAVAAGRLSGTELAVVTLVPLAAFELVVGLPSRHPGPPAGAPGGGPGLRGDRRAGASARSRAACTSFPTGPTTSSSGRYGLPTRVHRSLRSVESTSRSLRDGGWPSSGRAVQGSRRWPPYCSGSSRTRRARPPWTASSWIGWPATTCVPSSVWSPRTPTSSTPPSPKT